VGGSIPSLGTIFLTKPTQNVNASAPQARGVGGSIPSLGTIFLTKPTQNVNASAPQARGVGGSIPSRPRTTRPKFLT
ncbi:MAG: hypothetical protein KDJ49_06685, partial [Alphaproteobacteria bacterium]|nr:hypothetical protein [Alphaproteobacteria bacterium]